MPGWIRVSRGERRAVGGKGAPDRSIRVGKALSPPPSGDRARQKPVEDGRETPWWPTRPRVRQTIFPALQAQRSMSPAGRSESRRNDALRRSGLQTRRHREDSSSIHIVYVMQIVSDNDSVGKLSSHVTYFSLDNVTKIM